MSMSISLYRSTKVCEDGEHTCDLVEHEHELIEVRYMRMGSTPVT
jgi:hypothetical protein